MVDKKTLRHIGMKIGKMYTEKLFEVVSQIAEKNIVALGRKDSSYITFLFLEMPQNVSELRLKSNRRIGVVAHITCNYMLENITAHSLQKGILSLEMGIEGASSDVGLVDDILHGNAFVPVIFHKRAEG